jgi:NodT family efflux transporter outer membrane factor (OMF) lipoprotein
MRRARLLISLALTASLGGCSVTQPYVAPAAPAVPATFKEMGGWTPAAAADAMPRGTWWDAYGDPVLTALEARAATANPTLAAAVAAYDQARALAAQAAAGRYPEVDVGGVNTGARRSENAPLRPPGGANGYTTIQLAATASYEVDLWGRVRSLVAAGRAESQASAADLESVRLSLQAEVADDYLNLRGLDAQAKLLTDTVDIYAKALDLTQTRHSGGIASGLDVGRAQTQLSTARAQLTEVTAQRALLEHAIAAVIGEPASSFSLAPAQPTLTLPHFPIGAPAALLQRRPDIAAAERRAAAANAQVGIAQAARFPALTLGAQYGWQSDGSFNIFNAPDAIWMVGPELAGVLFDGGRLKAGVAAAKANFVQAGANYRGTVLTALKEVEDQLALGARLAAEARDQDEATAAAQRTQDLATIRYRDGAADYLEVVTAQAAALDAQRASITLQTRRLQASVDLVKAFGGAVS